jgi:hypothetical protein
MQSTRVAQGLKVVFHQFFILVDGQVHGVAKERWHHCKAIIILNASFKRDIEIPKYLGGFDT